MGQEFIFLINLFEYVPVRITGSPKLSLYFFDRTTLRFFDMLIYIPKETSVQNVRFLKWGKAPSYKIEGFWLLPLYFYSGKVPEITFFEVLSYFD